MSLHKLGRLFLICSLILVVVAGSILTVSAQPLLQGATVEPVTVYDSDFNYVSTLDPQHAEDAVSVDPINNLFLGLTDVDPKTSQIRPSIATDWTINDDGTVWTFNLRKDVPWVRYDPKTQKTTEVRKVTAADFEYAFKRACDPRLGAYYTPVAAAMVKGCDVVSHLDQASIKESDFDQIGVKALSDTQLQVTTQGQLGYFLDATSLWIFRAVPKEIIDEFGDKWIDPGNIVTDGPFVVDQFDQTNARIYIKNPLYPNVLDNYGGNVERIITNLNPTSAPWDMYQNDQLDTAFIPFRDLTKYRSDPKLKPELVQRTELTTYYFGFMYDKPPFDNVHVRRAFSAIIDRNQFVQEHQDGLGAPIAHFMPPGIRGAVGISEVGIGKPNNLGFDPDYAKKELAAGGYPDCKGLPNITILTYYGASDWGEFLRTQAHAYLNCDPALFSIESKEFSVLIQAIKKTVPTAERPSIYTLGWSADYPDAHNWMHDVISCNGDNSWKRPCNDLDKKIDAAGRETNPDKRDQMYRELEEGFFGVDGEFPIAPLFVNVEQFAVKTWFKGFFQTDGLFGGKHWDTYQIDQQTQLAARVAGAARASATPGAGGGITLPTPTPSITETPSAQ